VSPVEFERERIRRMFPRLAEEIETGENKVEVKSVLRDTQTRDASSSRKFDHYNPDVIDFIRRCDTESQASEVIAFMEKRGEIDKIYAKELRNRLKEQGVRSFGSKKEVDYYSKHGEL
jgi:hypothetical protein